jgi:hypothetical protein
MPNTLQNLLNEREPLLGAVRVFLILIIWAIWIPCRGLIRAVGWSWRYLCSKRWRWMTSLVVSGFLLLAGIKFVPLLYGRFALIYEASFLARTSIGRSSEEIRSLLVHRAFQLGYTNVLDQDEAFTIENTSSDDGTPLCVVSINLRQRVNILGFVSMPFRIQTQVTNVVDADYVKPKSLEDRIFGGG